MADIGKALSSAGSGAATGATIGSAVPGLGTGAGAILGALLGAGGSMGAGLLGGEKKETPTQGKQRELVDELLRSLSGEGQFSQLFNADESAFQKSFVDPAKEMFKSQIAPQIQQSFISGGQQRSTGLEDQLARAGVNLDQMLNQNFMKFQQEGQSNQINMIARLLGQAEGAPEEMDFMEKLKGGAAGYLGSEAFGKGIKDILGAFSKKPALNTDKDEPRKGYTP